MQKHIISLLYFTLLCLAFASQISKATCTQLQTNFTNKEPTSNEESKRWTRVVHDRRGNNAEPNIIKKPNPHSGTTSLLVPLVHVISCLWILINITCILA